jgi:hypothetical protein
VHRSHGPARELFDGGPPFQSLRRAGPGSGHFDHGVRREQASEPVRVVSQHDLASPLNYLNRSHRIILHSTIVD